jgi:hypothetical protein
MEPFLAHCYLLKEIVMLMHRFFVSGVFLCGFLSLTLFSFQGTHLASIAPLTRAACIDYHIFLLLSRVFLLFFCCFFLLFVTASWRRLVYSIIDCLSVSIGILKLFQSFFSASQRGSLIPFSSIFSYAHY